MASSDRVSWGAWGHPALLHCGRAVLRRDVARGGTGRLAVMLGGCGVVALESWSQLGSQAACGVPPLPTIALPVPEHMVAVPVGSKGAALEENLSRPALGFVPWWCLRSLVGVAASSAAPPGLQMLLPCFPLLRL